MADFMSGNFHHLDILIFCIANSIILSKPRKFVDFEHVIENRLGTTLEELQRNEENVRALILFDILFENFTNSFSKLKIIL